MSKKKFKSTTPAWVRVVAIILAIGMVVSSLVVIGAGGGSHSEPERIEVSEPTIRVQTEDETPGQNTEEGETTEDETESIPTEEESEPSEEQ